MSVRKYEALLILYLSASLCNPNEVPLGDILTNYEHLSASDLRHNTIRRSAGNTTERGENIRQIHFYSLGRSFSIHLTSHQQLFATHFKAVTVDKRGQSHHVPVNKDNFHIGHVIGDSSSSVTAHLSEEGILTAHIKTANETFYIEPAQLHIRGSHDSHMIIYKLSDVKQTNTSVSACSLDYETAPPPVASVLATMEKQLQRSHVLRRRQSRSTLNTCTLALVVDYRFYTFLLSSRNTVITTLVSRLSNVNSLSFRPTQWVIDADENTITNQGLQIGTIIIHTEPSLDSSHYNSEAAGQLTIQNLLRSFSRGNWADYCLAHLFTHNQFPSGKLGLAYISSPDEEETGGICSERVIDAYSGDIVIYNTGLSVASTQTRLLLPHEAELIIAHEIGHSWGSPHDPGDDANCRLRYLMNEFAQDGTQPTHREFSLCSRISIGRVLVSKTGCFQALSSSLCGNYIIDEGEQCDGGRLTVENGDTCCNSSCFLRAGTTCSDINHACCQNCSVAPANSKVCHFVGNISNDCTIQTSCNGLNRECPTPLAAPEGSICLQGRCQYQDQFNTTLECVPLCSLAGLDQCLCEGNMRCVECCVNATGDGTCQPLRDNNGEVIFFPNGIFCDQGICTDGNCVDQTQDFASQLWSVITSLNSNEFAIFLRENIVTCVLIISLLLWIPGSCIFHWLCDVKKVWKRCVRNRSDAHDGTKQPFIAQSSWVLQTRADLTPLLSMEDHVISSDLFQPIEEPEDTMPLPPGYHNDYSKFIHSTESQL